MQLQATCKRSQDSMKLLEQLNDIDKLRDANVRLSFDTRSPVDRKLLEYLTAAANGPHRLSPELRKAIGIALFGSAGVIVYGLIGLFGFG